MALTRREFIGGAAAVALAGSAGATSVLTVLASGRSNCWGGGSATDGAPSSVCSAGVTAWNNDNKTDLTGANGSAFVTPVFGQVPFRATAVNNNAPTWFCDRAARLLDDDVRLIMPCRGGTAIGDWLSGGGIYDKMRSVYTATGCDPADLALWIHGEGEESDPSGYKTKCATVFAGWRTDGMLGADAPILISGAPPDLYPLTYQAQQQLAGSDSRLHFIPTTSLEIITNEEHWTGSSLVRLGWDLMWNTYAEIIGWQPGGEWMDVFIVAEELPAGTDGGSNTAGSWVKRSFNTVVQACTGCSIVSGEAVLGEGKWLLDAEAPAYGTLRGQARLYNVTGSATLRPGANARSEALTSGAESIRSRAIGTIEVPTGETRTIRLEQYFQQVKTTNGLGASNLSASGVNGVFSQMVALKVA